MHIPVLLTKLYPPPAVRGHVPRRRLIERLQTGLTGKLTILSAPPGFGKTTLLAAWLAENKNEKVSWYSLDEDDNEPERFFAYIAASLRLLEPDPVPVLDALLTAGSANPRELTVALLNDLSEFAIKSVVLVLDDYHHITHQPIHDSLAYLIDYLPNNITSSSSAAPTRPCRWDAGVCVDS